MNKFEHILNDPEVITLLDIFEEKLFLVGGCVRDAILNKKTSDIDFASKFKPNEVIEILEKNKIKHVDIGLKHGTVTAVINNRKFEITSFRKDLKTDGRHADVDFSEDMEEDAARRDFTINALYLDKFGKFYDFHGGFDDINNRKIRFIGDPEKRVSEDYLRIMRFFRFSAMMQLVNDNKEILEIFKNHHKKLDVISNERLWHEFSGLLKSEDPSNALKEMQEVGILKEHFCNCLISQSFDILISVETKIKYPINHIFRLSVLLNNDQEKINNFISKYTLTKNESTELSSYSQLNKKIVSYLSMQEARLLLYKLGVSRFQDEVILNWVNDPYLKNEVNWRSLCEVANTFEKPKFDLEARDVIGMGVSEGPLVGEILTEVEDWWAENGFIDDKFSLIERLKAVVQARK